jgi:ATP-dependent DNA helicase RecQ
MRDYIATDRCRLEFLRQQLDDPTAAPCERCDNCTGTPVAAMVDDASIAAARTRLDSAGVELAPHTRWPSGLDSIDPGIKGVIAEADRCLAGRAVGRLTDIGWGPRLRDLLHESVQDQPVPDEVVRAATVVLRDWPWEARPVAIATVPSVGRPTLIGSLGEQLASLGRMTFLGPLERAGQGASGLARSNSAHRVRALHEAFSVTSDQRDMLRDLGGDVPILLVDDQVDSGWTMTLAGRVLRRAGAGAVLPFALAKVR